MPMRSTTVCQTLPISTSFLTRCPWCLLPSPAPPHRITGRLFLPCPPSPFVVAQARQFAHRPDVAWIPNDAKRIERMHQLAYGRSAEPDEIELGLRFLAAAGKAKLSAREQYAQVLLLANEFAFVD